MFGLEDNKDDKKKSGAPQDFQFELESDLQDITKLKNLQEKVNDKTQSIKTLLRSGKSKEEFDKMGVLLQGYVALLKVMKKVKSH